MKYLKLFEDYNLIWNDSDDWEFDEDSDEYYNIGETENFNVRFKNDNILYIFKDINKQKIQLKELQSSIIVNLERNNFNRVHINGIAYSIKNKGYGKEIYNSLIENNKIISTSLRSASEDVLNVWNSLKKNNKYFYCKIDNFYIGISKYKEEINKFIENKVKLLDNPNIIKNF
jgi:hypothetical protein